MLAHVAVHAHVLVLLLDLVLLLLQAHEQAC